MLKNTLSSKTSLSMQHVLTPQQVQYLRILQLPVASLEQTIKQEIEENPFLEEDNELFDSEELDTQMDSYSPAPDQTDNGTKDYAQPERNAKDKYSDYDDDDTVSYSASDGADGYEHYNDYWEDDADFTPNAISDSDNDFEPFQIKTETTLYDSLIAQVNMLDLSLEEDLIARYIIGNIDEDGYLRRAMDEMVMEINSQIANRNFNIQKDEYERLSRGLPNANLLSASSLNDEGDGSRNKDLSKSSRIKREENPAKQFELSGQSLDVLFKTMDKTFKDEKELPNQEALKQIAESLGTWEKILTPITMADFEKVLAIVQTFDPPGIASRNIQECLLAQLKLKSKKSVTENLAIQILADSFDEFSKKHFLTIQKLYGITEDELKDVFDVIKKLNPKPGGDDYISQLNTVIPDFIVRYDNFVNDFMITLNDSNVPAIRVSPTHEKILNESKNNKQYNKQTKEWIKDRYESAKFFIQAIKQRNVSMIMVMTAIIQRQRGFFLNDVRKLKPMIYKDISDDTALDISTVCRIVNDKFVHTSTGTYELKFFFSESLPNADGAEISTTVIKDRIKELVGLEPKHKPYSDDKLMKLLKDDGYNVARRTIAKYREMLKIPVARMRKEI